MAAAARLVGAPGRAATVITWVATSVPRALVAVSVMAKTPAAVNVWVGFWTVEAGLPSPKFQDHEVGTPVVVSVNLTARGGAPTEGVGVNDATGMAGTGGVTVMIFEVAAVPRALVTSSVTVKLVGGAAGAMLKVWVGLGAVTAGVPSPKFHDQAWGAG